MNQDTILKMCITGEQFQKEINLDQQMRFACQSISAFLSRTHAKTKRKNR
jgi:hypothetical protein